MAEKCVKIEVYDDGRVTVGLVPQDVEQRPVNGQPEERAEQAWMKPAASVDEALAVAKDLLAGENENAERPQSEAAEREGPTPEQDFAAGFQKRSPMGPAQ